jgi:hypothetical protein
MDLITHVPGITNSAAFTPGANTPSPWNTSHTGLTDGTSPNNATKNMAEIYNRLLLERAAIIQDAGLVIDYNNWTQMTTAIRLLGVGHGGSCPVTGPANPPTAAAPYTRYTSVTPYFEEWAWNGVAWGVVSKDYRYSAFQPSVNITAGATVTLISAVVPRSGRIYASGVVCGLSNSASLNALVSNLKLTRLGVPTTLADSQSKDDANANGQYVLTRPQAPIDVLAGDTISTIATTTGGTLLSAANGNAIYYQYV